MRVNDALPGQNGIVLRTSVESIIVATTDNVSLYSLKDGQMLRQ